MHAYFILTRMGQSKGENRNENKKKHPFAASALLLSVALYSYHTFLGFSSPWWEIRCNSFFIEAALELNQRRFEGFR